MTTCDAPIARSASFRAVLEALRRVARVDGVSVHLSGATGTGKSMLAAFLHRSSARSNGPFVVANCAAFTGELVESELFGAARGSHSTAVVDREGLLAAADGGTLFLDEIAELSPSAQAKLLRALENGYRPLGAIHELKSDVRIVTASHSDLDRLVAEGRIRSDLRYRLGTWSIRVPGLSERTEDIPALAVAFLDRLASTSSTGPHWSPVALHALSARAWPGNVRELRQVVERAYVEALDEPTIEPHHIEPNADEPPTLDVLVDRFQRGVIERTLAEVGNTPETGRRLGVSRSRIYELMRRLGIDPPRGASVSRLRLDARGG